MQIQRRNNPNHNSTNLLNAGSEALQAALVFYNSAKVAASQDISGAKAVYEELKRQKTKDKRLFLINGRNGGESGSRPAGLLDWDAKSGANGNAGNSTNHQGGNAAKIEKGSEISFGGDLKAGGGGHGGYGSSQSGGDGSNGHVVIHNANIIYYNSDPSDSK